ncbi:MAG: hypothetical protein JSU85_08625 [Candidatus Zixiibacteriota bacterium]|nr:MAG: hypothetical protein JSU85_08625 [candidate division Zixibacteria bacterium]
MKLDKKKEPGILPANAALNRMEKSAYFTPLSFIIILFAFVIFFKDFIFSNQIFHSGDLVQAGFFFRSFFVNYFLSNGAVPQWDPYIFGGLPFVDAFHGDIFYPFSKLVFLDPLFKFLSYNLIFHIYLSGIFTYFCARQFRLSKIASLMSAIAYMFSAYLISLIAPFHDGKIFATSLFPLSILFLERGYEKKSFLNFSIYGVVVGVIILTSHAQMAYFALWANFLYTIFKLIFLYIKKKSITQIAHKGLLTVYGVLIGIMISAIQYYPGYYYTKNYSPRSEVKKGWEWATSWSLHEEEAFSLLIPEFAGANTTEARTFYWGKNAFKDNSETVGIVGLFLAIIGIIFYRKKEAYFFGGLAIFSLIYALGANTPFFKLFYNYVFMVKSLRAPSMIMFLFVFSIAILAGMGLQYLLEFVPGSSKRAKKALNYVIFGFPGLMLFLALIFSLAGRGALKLWCSLFYSDASTTMVQQGISKFDVAVMNLPAIQSGAWLGFLFVLIASLCVWLYTHKKAGIIVIIILLIIPIINSLRFNGRFISLFDPNPYLRTNSVVEYLKKDPTKFRVQDFTQNSRLNLAYHGIELVTGYHGNQLKWYDQLLGGPSQRNLPNPRLLNLVGAKYIIIPSNQRIPDGYFGADSVTVVQNFPGGQILRNDNAFPRVFLIDRVMLLENAEAIDNLVLRGKDDLRDIVYLEEQPDIVLPDSSQIGDSAWIESYETDSVVVATRTQNNNILVLTDNYYESWKVFVDGVPGRILRAYGSFRAVAIPAGTQQVMFKYESKRYRTGKTITMATLFYLALIFGYFSLRGIVPKFRARK